MDTNNLIISNFDLTPYTTFGIPARARYFAEYKSLRELERLMRTPEFNDNELLQIGAGSNLLFVHDFNGIVLHSAIRGVTFYRKNDDTVYAIAGAGEEMDYLIARSIEEGYSGLENLSHIPGDVGASVVQNVGAYGVEAGDLVHSAECYDLLTHKVVTLRPEDMRFGYRDSMFKNEGKGRYIVLRVSYLLNPTTKARNLDYGPLKSLAERLGHTPAAAEVREEVIAIRKAKLPEPGEISSAGSFFKNPIVNRHYYKEEMLRRDPEIPCYEVDENRVKIPAGWLIEHAGLKGYTIGKAQVYPKQCLVITNTGGATAEDVVRLSEHVRRTVMKKFGVMLHPEVNFIDTDIEVTLLGSGTSKGIPEIGCDCDVCTSEDPHDKRTRSSVLVRTHGMNLLIDASPDFRTQALREDIRDIDAVLITHSHYDHVGGLDDLRPLCAFRKMDIYARPDVLGDLRRRLDYCFKEDPYPGVPGFELHEVGDRPFLLNGLKITPISVSHGKLPIVGYRIGDFAYITDCSHIEFSEMWKLEGIDTLIINALRHRPHFAHFSFEQSLDFIKEVNPRQAYLTHICHDTEPASVEDSMLPDNVRLAYDGLKFTVK
jgi:UDP-N-acetylmuramate dehydrogenase